MIVKLETLALENGYLLEMTAIHDGMVKSQKVLEGETLFERPERSELGGLIMALELMKKPAPLEIYPLSFHVALGLQNLHIWKSRDFTLVNHSDLWVKLEGLLSGYSFEVKRVGTLIEPQIPLVDDLRDDFEAMDRFRG